MKLSETTISLLKNFSTINPSILVNPGKQLKTISINKAVLAIADVDEEFDRQFGLKDLSKLLALLSLHQSPDLVLEDQNLVLVGANSRSRAKVRYTEPKLIVAPPNKEIKVKDFDVSFKLTQEDLSWIEKVGAILSCPHVIIENVDGQVTLSAADAKGESVDNGSLVIGPSPIKDPFRFVLKVDNLKLLEGNYMVELSSRGLSRFANQDTKVTYFVAVENGLSHFGNKE